MPSDATPRLRDRRGLFRYLQIPVAFVGTGFAAMVAACNVHEVAHATVGTLLGWEVESVSLCLPNGGRVVYSHVGTWAMNLQGYAGGFVAAAFLMGIYALVVARPARPRRGHTWWAAGLGLVLPIGPQIAVGMLEGMVRPGEDYTVRYSAVLPPLIVVGLAVVAVTYAWRWRSGAPDAPDVVRARR